MYDSIKLAQLLVENIFIGTHFVYFLNYSLDISPTPAKRVCMENDGSVTAGQQTAGSVDGKNELQPVQEINLVKSLEPFIKYVRWENRDADYFLKTVRGNNIMTEENENAAMSNMLQSFIDNQPLVDKFHYLTF